MRHFLIATLVAFGLVATPLPVRATCGTLPYTFQNNPNGSVVDANTTNANNQFLLSCASSVDNTQVGPAGIFANQIIPTTVAQGVFGGSQPYTFPAQVSAATFVSTSAIGVYDFTFPSSGVSGKTGFFGGTGSSPKVMGISPTLLGVDDTNQASRLALDTAGDLGVPSVFTGPLSATTGTFSAGVSAANLTASTGTLTVAQVVTNGETVNGTSTIGNLSMINQVYYSGRGIVPYLAISGTGVPHIEAGYVSGNNNATGVTKNFNVTFGGNPTCQVSYQYAGLLPTTTPQATFNVNTAGIVIYGYTLPIAYTCIGL